VTTILGNPYNGAALVAPEQMAQSVNIEAVARPACGSRSENLMESRLAPDCF